VNNLGIIWLSCHERSNCQVGSRSKIATEWIPRILRMPTGNESTLACQIHSFCHSPWDNFAKERETGGLDENFKIRSFWDQAFDMKVMGPDVPLRNIAKRRHLWHGLGSRSRLYAPRPMYPDPSWSSLALVKKRSNKLRTCF
jgi:hypothetical protein